MTSRLLGIRLIGIMLLRMWLLLLAFYTISPTMVMTTSHLISFGSVRILVPKVCQNFGLRDGFINRPDLSAFQLRPGPTLQPIHEVEQHIFIREVGNLKRKGGELLHICAYVARLLQFPKLALRLIDDVVMKECLFELLLELLPSVDGAMPFPISDSLRLHHSMTISERYNEVVFILFHRYLLD